SSVALGVGLGAALLLITTGVHWWKSRRWGDDPPAWLWPAVILLCTGPVVAVAFALRLGGLLDSLSRFSPVLLILGAAGILAAHFRNKDAVAASMGLHGAYLFSVFAALFALRITEPRNHAYFLYWDRYLFSEAFPGLVILAAVGGDAIWQGVLRMRRPWLARAAALAGVALFVWSGARALRYSLPVARSTLFADAYQDLERLEESTSAEGELPIIYSGFDDQPKGWIFPNTFRAMALPLTETFGRRVLNIYGRGPFSPDPVPTPHEVREIMEGAGVEAVYLVAARRLAQNNPICPEVPGASVREVGTVGMDIPVICRRVERAEEYFQFVLMDFDVCLVRLGSP
ncbi:MAG: hypothetical protein JRJ84_22310, partial [Deltaproteobacteria bacterium]|nr:hypothetical protein [Deltaproteobacteria bacterium]